MHIAYIGLGKMGSAMAERIARSGRHQVSAWDPSVEAREALAGRGVKNLRVCAKMSETLRENKSGKRSVWLMVPHEAVDEVLSELVPLLEAGDTVIDGGNCHFRDSRRRGAELAQKQIDFLDVGVSGGPAGAREGACLMVGGKEEVYRRHRELLEDIAASGALALFGPVGAGHFVKMVHNGIEYGMMQAIAEGFTLLAAADFPLDLRQVAEIYNRHSVIESRLVGDLAEAFGRYGTDLTDASGRVAATGEGLWTVRTAAEKGIDLPVIRESVDFRARSQKNPSYTGRILTALRAVFGGHSLK